MICRAGAKGLHNQWAVPAEERNYDLLISAYSPDTPKPTDDDVMFEFRPGAKIAGYMELFKAHHELLSKYKYVALFDDDILCTAEELCELFTLADSNDLKICQPALTHDSYFSYAGQLKVPGAHMRYVNFIEMMCPIFSQKTLFQIMPLYSMGYEVGIDLIWCNIAYESKKDFAIIDSVPVQHTRPVGRLKTTNGFEDGRDYQDDIVACRRIFDIEKFPLASYEIRTERGKTFDSRLSIFLRSLSMFNATLKTEQTRARAVAVGAYLFHTLFSPRMNVPLSMHPTARQKFQEMGFQYG
ncbi:hypothetical protein [Henriciella aquimarina]|uniref:hypothetical protein n=1 Tax=Henriciella aquimarina TaxID=545261 RepID=UPI00117BD87E|nr:hypothetical protein [Henriciella aquimarina]